jgi:hypothetical protein
MNLGFSQNLNCLLFGPFIHIGADDFTPLLIYVVIKAQTAHLASNLVYIERYRVASKLASEAQYYFIQLVGPAMAC